MIWMLLSVVHNQAQPQLVHSNIYAPLGNVGYDSSHRRIYINVLNGCPTWNIPCALNYTFSAMYNLVNKHALSDNSLGQVLGSKFHTACPVYPVNYPSTAYAHQSIVEENFIYTNFGYYFDKIDTNLAPNGPVWSFSPAVSPSTKEIMSFTMRNDSLFLFQKDSTNGSNYYNVLLKNKQTGNDIPYSSLTVTNVAGPKGAILGYIRNTELMGNSILVTGSFSAYSNGNFICRNMVLLDVASGSLSAPPLTFAAGTDIYDLKKHNNLYYISGKFSQVSGQIRYCFAAFDQNFNLVPNTPSFTGDNFSDVWVDKFVFYDRYLIAKGAYNSINQTNVSFTNDYKIRALDMVSGLVMNWTLNVPPAVTPFNVFQLHRNKLFIKNQGSWNSAFYVYCLEPVLVTGNIVYPGSNLPNPSPSVNICAPDSGNNKLFVAPIRFADTYQWTYTGTNATLVPLGNGASAKLITTTLSTNGVLSVTAYNDCGMSKTATLNVIINQKPIYTSPPSPLKVICNPDSTQLNAVSQNPNVLFFWRDQPGNSYSLQPVHVKQQGTYFCIATNTLTGCSDSNFVNVVIDQNKPNAKLISHNYLSPLTPVDTLTCFQPSVTLSGGSDSSNVITQWKSISGASVYANPYTISQQSNIKLVVTNTINACADSSIIVLVSVNKQKPAIAIQQKTLSLNCSVSTVTLSAQTNPTNCVSTWSGNGNQNLQNPNTTSTTGTYVFLATDPANGCVSKDSATVIYEPKILLNTSGDKTVCKGSSVGLFASAVGTLNNVGYIWSTGAMQSSINVQASSTQAYTVNAVSGACSGSASLKVTVPTAIKDSILTFRDCNENNKGTLVVFAKGGIPPYQFSLNNQLQFSASNTYTGLPYGSYLVFVKDSIGCIISKTVSVNDNAALPTPKFLASTLNQKGDTIVLVDVSVPKPDSIQWTLPIGVTRTGGTMFHPVLTAIDTGNYSIIMKGFFGNCQLTTNKWIRFGPIDTTLARLNNNNGIKSFTLYPNPNSGSFTVAVEFFKKQNASIQVWDGTAQLLFQSATIETNGFALPIHLPQQQNGTYILRVVGEYDTKRSHFIISK